MHDSLIRIYPTTSSSEAVYYSAPMPYLIVNLPIKSPAPGAYYESGVRKIRVSGSDIVYRYLLEASTCLHVRPERYRAFDKLDPQSLPCLFYILENVYMTARSMDESTVQYLQEANEVSQQMRSIFIALCVVASLVELVTVVAIFRPALTRIYAEMNTRVEELSKLDDRKLLAMHATASGHGISSSEQTHTANAKVGTKGKRRTAVALGSEDESQDGESVQHDVEENVVTAESANDAAELAGFSHHRSLEDKVIHSHTAQSQCLSLTPHGRHHHRHHPHRRRCPTAPTASTPSLKHA